MDKEILEGLDKKVANWCEGVEYQILHKVISKHCGLYIVCYNNFERELAQDGYDIDFIFVWKNHFEGGNDYAISVDEEVHLDKLNMANIAKLTEKMYKVYKRRLARFDRLKDSEFISELNYE